MHKKVSKSVKKTRISYNQKQTNQQVNLYVIGVECQFRKSLYKTPFKLKKMIWYDEIADSDMFTPSCPHLHSIDGKYKLNVYTGELYDIRLKKIIRDKRVNNDELKELWSESKFLQFAMKMRQLYFEKYPQSQLPQIPVFV